MFGCNIPAEVWVLWGYKSGIQEDLQGGPCSEWCAFGWEGNLCKLILNKIKKVDVVLMCVCICGFNVMLLIVCSAPTVENAPVRLLFSDRQGCHWKMALKLLWWFLTSRRWRLFLMNLILNFTGQPKVRYISLNSLGLGTSELYF